MNPEAIMRARDRYRIAAKAIERMKAAVSLEEQEDEWFTFLRAWKGVYTIFEQAVKANPKATMWFGQRNAFRRKDPLLQYLFQARNDDEHGLARTTARLPGQITIGKRIGPGPIDVSGFSISYGPSGLEVIGGEHSDNVDMTPEIIPPRLMLVPVRDRNRITVYDPPETHLGSTFEQGRDPIAVAEAALIYIGQLISEADGL